MGALDTEHPVLQDLLAEFSLAVTKHQPELSVRVDKNFVLLEGKLVVYSPQGPFDCYDTLIGIPSGFPLENPVVFETGGRIPKEADRHVFEDHGNCCLGVWEEWLLRTEDPSAAAFLAGPLHDYFLSQSWYEAKGDWPFGDRSHGRLGVLEAYSDLLEIELSLSQARSYLSLLAKAAVKGHYECPCGSGLRLRHCHRDKVEGLSDWILPDMAKRMLRRLRDK